MSQKLCYLLWSSDTDRARCRDLLVRDAAPRLLARGPERLVAHVIDPESRVRAPTPFHPKDPPSATGLVDLWLGDAEERLPYEQILQEAGFLVAGYLVEESIYRDYGGNPHAEPRSWPDGVRSPGIAQVTLLERPARLEREEWLRRWHGTMSPVSEAIQPRTRYVRNVVLRALSPDAPRFEGIVVECWPSARHLTNPFLFYGAKTPIGLGVNLFRILRAVTAFLDIRRIRTTMTGEYFLKTDFHP
jgi:hypothetical protein